MAIKNHFVSIVGDDKRRGRAEAANFAARGPRGGGGGGGLLFFFVPEANVLKAARFAI